jgi:hypothetical protein
MKECFFLRYHTLPLFERASLPWGAAYFHRSIVMRVVYFTSSEKTVLWKKWMRYNVGRMEEKSGQEAQIKGWMAVSVISWDWLLPRSASVPSGNEEESGFVQRRKQASGMSKQ